MPHKYWFPLYEAISNYLIESNPHLTCKTVLAKF